MKKALAVIAGFSFLCLASLPLKADNLVQNPGFEIIDSSSGFDLPSGWTMVNAASGSDFWVSAWDPHSGVNAMHFGGTTPLSYDSLEQTLTTTPGQTYSLSFWLDIDSGDVSSNDFQAYWDGALVQDIQSSTAMVGNYVEYFASITGTGSDLLNFQSYNAASYDHLDDISVSTVASTPSSSVPEPASLLLFGTALIGLSACRKLRRG